MSSCSHPAICTRRIRVTGRVQGVGYRAWAAGTAQALGLEGWVRNRLDGSVELVAQGAADKVDALIAACRHGPRMARVDDVEAESAPGISANGFLMKPTI